MKLLQINAVYGNGSTGVIVKDIHEICLKNGIDSHVAYSLSSISQQDIQNGYQIGSNFGKKLHALFSRINGKQAYFSRFSTKKFLKYIKKLSPDIVHLHNLHSNYINLNMLLDFLAKNDIQTVITLHDCWFYTGGCFHYTNANCFKWKDSCGNCPKKPDDTKAYFLDSSSKILRHREKYFSKIKHLTVIGVSQWIADEAKASILKNAEIVTIHNGIDLDFHKYTPSNLRQELGIDNNAFVVLGVANKWLLPINKDALLYVTSHLPQNAIMLMVGCNESQRSNLPKNVIGIPYIQSREKLREVYSSANVFVNCTREESLSLVNVEAQSCGLPIITYRNTGAKETVDECTGFSVEDGNYVALTEKLLEIIAENPSSTDKKRSTFIENKFSLTNNQQRHIELYRKLYEKTTH